MVYTELPKGDRITNKNNGSRQMRFLICIWQLFCMKKKGQLCRHKKVKTSFPSSI